MPETEIEPDLRTLDTRSKYAYQHFTAEMNKLENFSIIA